jgi:hypothetical protein
VKEYILIELLTRCGEYEFTSYLAREIDTEKISRKEAGDHAAKTFYDEFDREEAGWYYHNGGEVSTRLECVTSLSEAEFDVLYKLF